MRADPVGASVGADVNAETTGYEGATMDGTGVEDVFDVLDSDHRALLTLLASAATTADEDLLPSRCEQLVMTVVRHFVAEEQYLLPLVRRRLDDGERLAKAAFAQHGDIEDDLRRLEDLEHSASAARPILAEVEAGIVGHVTAQRDELFPALRSRCDAAELQGLAEEIIGSERLAPTRPRLVRPESAPLNKVVSLVAGYVDQVRDAYGRRGVAESHAEGVTGPIEPPPA